MVQDQLVEYITSQTKAGVSPETIKATLVAAGWQSADVDDTMKKVQSPAAGSPAATGGSQTISTAKTEPQAVVRVSDLISASGPSSNTMAASSTKAADARAEATKKFFTPTVTPGATNYQAPASRAAASPSSSQSPQSQTHPRGPIAVEVLLGILMVAFGALAAYFLFANRSLSAQVATLSSESSGVTAQVSTLQTQLDASTTALTAELASVTTENQQLALGLSFYAAPLGSPATITSTAALAGSVSGGGKYAYVITTPDGAKVTVANSKDPKVATLLLPLVGTASEQFAGTYLPGAGTITLTAINGASLVEPAAAASTTPSSTVSNNAPLIPAPAPSSTSSTTGQ